MRKEENLSRLKIWIIQKYGQYYLKKTFSRIIINLEILLLAILFYFQIILLRKKLKNILKMCFIKNEKNFKINSQFFDFSDHTF